MTKFDFDLIVRRTRRDLPHGTFRDAMRQYNAFRAALKDAGVKETPLAALAAGTMPKKYAVPFAAALKANGKDPSGRAPKAPPTDGRPDPRARIPLKDIVLRIGPMLNICRNTTSGEEHWRCIIPDSGDPAADMAEVDRHKREVHPKGRPFDDRKGAN